MRCGVFSLIAARYICIPLISILTARECNIGTTFFIGSSPTIPCALACREFVQRTKVTSRISIRNNAADAIAQSSEIVGIKVSANNASMVFHFNQSKVIFFYAKERNKCIFWKRSQFNIPRKCRAFEDRSRCYHNPDCFIGCQCSVCPNRFLQLHISCKDIPSALGPVYAIIFNEQKIKFSKNCGNWLILMQCGHSCIARCPRTTVHSCFFDNSRHIFLLKNIMKIWHIIPAPIVARTLNIYNSNQSIGDHLPALEPRYFMSSLV